MGSSVKALCPCGFSATYRVGGAMLSHRTHSYFPYRCSPCGIVSVNIAADELVCPNRKAHKITRIAGSQRERLEAEDARLAPKKKTLLEKIGLRVPKASSAPNPTSANVVCQWGDHELYDQPYQCPYCRQQTLRFTDAGIRFD